VLLNYLFTFFFSNGTTPQCASLFEASYELAFAESGVSVGI
jgi:hypothetical protein